MNFSDCFNALRSGLAGIAGVFYPPLCLTCLRPPEEPGVRICAKCRAAMRRAGDADAVRRQAEARLTGEGTVDAFLTLFLFEKRGTLQQAMHLLKYAGMHSIAVGFGRELGESMGVLPCFAGAEILVPVPLHPARLRERGYNQSERICAGIRETTGRPVLTGALRRTRNTPSQTALTLHERGENVRGAFRVSGRGAKQVGGRTVVLVDDVMTTGSTLLECAAVLRAAGAGSVLVATVAVADRRA